MSKLAKQRENLGKVGSGLFLFTGCGLCLVKSY